MGGWREGKEAACLTFLSLGGLFLASLSGCGKWKMKETAFPAYQVTVPKPEKDEERGKGRGGWFAEAGPCFIGKKLVSEREKRGVGRRVFGWHLGWQLMVCFTSHQSSGISSVLGVPCREGAGFKVSSLG